MLTIVSTPIGNLQDISFRAVETLKKVHLIAAEDTRHTKILTKHYDINTPLTSYHEHNKVKKAEELVRLLEGGQDIALVTDAGTPGISDPGYYLINAAKRNNIPITVIPGPTALIAGLTLSGLPPDRFVFEGFLPVKSAARRKKLEPLKGEERTIIFYESPYRVVKAIKDIEEVLNNPYIVIAREITKKFEEVIEGPCDEVCQQLTNKKLKGEFVVLINLKVG